ncbi:MAG: thioredoxin 1 [Phycisphaerales bacterium]|jgi:thioredoxin 1
MASDKVVHLTEGAFDKVIQGDKPVLVDFWAEWCGPCRALGPTIDKLADSQDGKAIIAKVDIDAEGPIGAKYGVSSIPTVILFAGGKEVNRFVGLRQEAEYAEAIEAAAGAAT